MRAPGTSQCGEGASLTPSPTPSAITVREGRNRISLRCGVCGVRSCYEGPRARRAEFAGMFTAAHVFCEGPWWEEDSNE